MVFYTVFLFVCICSAFAKEDAETIQMLSKDESGDPCTGWDKSTPGVCVSVSSWLSGSDGSLIGLCSSWDFPVCATNSPPFFGKDLEHQADEPGFEALALGQEGTNDRVAAEIPDDSSSLTNMSGQQRFFWKKKWKWRTTSSEGTKGTTKGTTGTTKTTKKPRILLN